jgi:hypothetical protein
VTLFAFIRCVIGIAHVLPSLIVYIWNVIPYLSPILSSLCLSRLVYQVFVFFPYIGMTLSLFWESLISNTFLFFLLLASHGEALTIILSSFIHEEKSNINAFILVNLNLFLYHYFILCFFLWFIRWDSYCSTFIQIEFIAK